MMKTMRLSTSLLTPILILALLAAISFIIPVTVSAQTATTGTIQGTVANGTTGNPVPGIDVTLSAFNSDGFISDTTVVAGGDGSFTFEDVDTSDGIVYAVSASWRGVLYSSGMIMAGTVGRAPVTVQVYEPTTDRSLVRLTSRGLVLSEIIPSTGTLLMLDITAIEMTGNQTLVADDTGRSLEFPVPRNATQASIMPGFDFGTPTIENAVIFATGPLRPGPATPQITYSVQYTGTSVSLDIQHVYPTDIFQVLVPVEIAGHDQPVSVSGGNLESRGTESIGGQQFNIWYVRGLEPNSSVRVTFGGLPESGFMPNELKVLEPTLLAAGALLAASAVIIVMIRKKRIVPAEPELELAVTAGYVESREELVQQLQVLQDQYESGMLEESVYLAERRFLLEKLRDVTRYLRDLPLDQEP